MIRSSVAAMFVLLASATAQVHPAQPAPELAVDFGKAEPLRLQGDTAPTVAVIAFHRSLDAAAIDADLLRRLEERHSGTGLAVLVVVPERSTPMPGALGGCRIAVDADGKCRAAFVDESMDGYVVVVRGGRIAWLGSPAHGLETAVARVLEGSLDPVGSLELHRQRQLLLGSYAEGHAREIHTKAVRLSTEWRRDGIAWAMAYLSELRLGEASTATLTAAAAIEALEPEPRTLAAFADLVLRSDRAARALAPRLASELAPRAAADPDDLVLQLALLRACVFAGDHRQVGRVAQTASKDALLQGSTALEFAEILTQDSEPSVHKELVARALAAATRFAADPRFVQAVRYAYLLRCTNDRGAARELVADWVEEAKTRSIVNNTAWELLTAVPLRGRYDMFALALAERMLEQKSALEPFELDTVALAMFTSGRVAEAIDYELLAIERGGVDDGYHERLERYRSALPVEKPR